jgi:DNA-directed RNA polymerase subunit RPC12/RpoP
LDLYFEFINTINWCAIITFTGGLAMSQIEEKTKKSSGFTCPNVSCGKVFTKPLRALNLQQDTEEPYDACPYCLTEIVVEKKPAVYDEPETFEQEEIEEPEETEVEEQKPMEEQVETPEKSSECLHYLGYLSERSPKEQIPDECMMCKDIVACMLKKMKG